MIAIGSVCVSLGVLGIFLPLLPTTPFLLLAAACYIRSSDRLYMWLISNRWVGRYIRNYREGRGVPFSTKVIGIGLLWLTIGYSAFYIVDSLIIIIVLILIAVGVTTHLVLMKTYRRED